MLVHPSAIPTHLPLTKGRVGASLVVDRPNQSHKVTYVDLVRGGTSVCPDLVRRFAYRLAVVSLDSPEDSFSASPLSGEVPATWEPAVLFIREGPPEGLSNWLVPENLFLQFLREMMEDLVG
jgi:hypothetical protein